MSGEWLANSGLPRLVVGCCLVGLVVCLCVARVSQIGMDDDNLYLAYGAQSSPARAAELEQSLIDRVESSPRCEESAYRLTLRQHQLSNYAGYAGLQGALQRGATFFVPAGSASIIWGTLATKALFFVLFSSALLIAAARGSSRELEAAVVGAFISLVALDVAAKWVPTFSNIEIAKPWRAIPELISSFFIPPRSHSYFGVTPRNAALLLFVFALLLKWQRNLSAAILALVLVAPIHQIYGGLALFLFAGTSALSCPDVFATPLRRLLLLASGLVYVWRGQFFAHLSMWLQIVCVLVLIGAALLFFRGVCSGAFAAFRQRLLGRRIEREVSLDAAALVTLALVLTLISLIGAQVTSGTATRDYVWRELASRIWSFARFPAAIAGFLAAFEWMKWDVRFRGRNQFAAVAALSCLVLSGLALSQKDTRTGRRLARAVQRTFDAPLDTDAFNPLAEEDRIYAHLTMVAAGQMEAAEADASIVYNRPIRCKGRAR